jgi:hypothetical protein
MSIKLLTTTTLKTYVVNVIFLYSKKWFNCSSLQAIKKSAIAD